MAQRTSRPRTLKLPDGIKYEDAQAWLRRSFLVSQLRKRTGETVRLPQIREILTAGGFAVPGDASLTRDLERLGALPRFRHIHGGIVVPEPDAMAISAAALDGREKRAIGAEAAASLEPNSRVFVAEGSTLAALGPALCGLEWPGTLITNSTLLLDTLSDNLPSDLTVHMTGGTFLRSAGALYGPSAEKGVEALAPSISVLTVSGIACQRRRGMGSSALVLRTYFSQLEPLHRKALTTATRRVVFLVRSQRMGGNEGVILADGDELGALTCAEPPLLITDEATTAAGPGPDIIGAWREAGFHVKLVTVGS